MEEKITCDYPKCNKEGNERHRLDLTNKEDSSVNLPFCRYHYLIVIGDHFKVKIVETEGKENPSFELTGPTESIELIEQVLGARELITKLESNNN